MPISANPNDTAPYVLRGDRAKLDQLRMKLAPGEPLPQPPTFHVRFHTFAQASEIRKELRAAEAEANAGNDDVAGAHLDRAIKLGVTRWEHFVDANGTPFSREALLPQILSDTELWELAYATLHHPRLTEEERRNFAPPSAGSGASPAGAGQPAATASA